MIYLSNSKNSINIKIMNKNHQQQTATLKKEVKELIRKYQKLKEKEKVLGIGGTKYQEQMFEITNSISMRLAKEGLLEHAEMWMRKAEPFVEKNIRLTVIFNNNLACIYKHQKEYQKAQQHLQISQSILSKVITQPGYNKRYDKLLSDCWLNLAALYSSKKMHAQALSVIIKSQQLIVSHLENEKQKFMEQLIVAKYNKIVELQHLNRIEEAYQQADDLKKTMYKQRIYGNFLEEKINHAHQDLRKKVYGSNRHKRASSLAASLSKLRESSQSQLKSHPHSRKMSTLISKRNIFEIEQTKQNYNSLHYRSTIASQPFNSSKPYKSKNALLFTSSSRSKLTPMLEITNNATSRT